ncbi:fibronectin type III domain-containing protein [bacterium]|nr:fibronectin type III domain-containing protein [bacterium]
MSLEARFNLIISFLRYEIHTVFSYHLIPSLSVIAIVICGCENDSLNSDDTYFPEIQALSAQAVDDKSVYIEWFVEPQLPGFEFILQRSANDVESWTDVVKLSYAPFIFTDTDLTEGNDYTYQVLAISQIDTSEPSNPAFVRTLPKAPYNLSVFSFTGSTLDLTWVDNSEVETGYELWRRQGSNGEYDYQTLLPSNCTALNDTGLLGNKRYYYRVRAIMDNQNSHWSDEIIAATNLIPTSLIAEVRSNGTVWLGWSDYCEFETGFLLERYKDENIDKEITLNRNTTSNIDSDISEGETYGYQIRVLYNEALSPPSERATVFTLPFSPVNLRVIQDVDSDTAAFLEWDDVSSIETGYEIQRKRQYESDFKTVGLLGINTTSFRDAGLEPYSWYYYKVRTLLDTLTSDWSNLDSMYTEVLLPLKPTELTAEAIAATLIKLEWTDNAVNEFGYVVESILPADNHWTCLDTLPVNSILFYKGGLTSESSYTFRIYAYNGYGNSPYSDLISITTPKEIPANPTDLREIEVTYSSVEIAWQDNSNNESGFRVERSMYPLYQWRLIGLTDGEKESFIDGTVNFNETYCYRVAAFNEAGRSAWTRELIVNTPDGPPGTPLYLHANPLSWNSIHLIWTRSTDNETGYRIARMSEFENDFSIIAENGYGEVFFDDTNLLSRTLYYYRVRAFNDFGISDWSNIDSARTQLNRAFWDNFESYQVGLPPEREDWSYLREGSSFVAVTDRDAHQSSKSTLFYDPHGTEGSYAMLKAEHEIIRDGRFECYLKMADNGYFNIQGIDGRDNVTFRILFNADNSFEFQNGDNLDSNNGYPVDEWFKLSVEFNVNNQQYSIAFDDEIVVENAVLMLDDHDGNCNILFSTLVDLDIERAYIDNVSISDNEKNFLKLKIKTEKKLSNGVKNQFIEDLDLR